MTKDEDEKLVGATIELLAPHFIAGTLRGVRDDDKIIKNYSGPKSLQMRVIAKGRDAGGTGGEQK